MNFFNTKTYNIKYKNIDPKSIDNIASIIKEIKIKVNKKPTSCSDSNTKIDDFYYDLGKYLDYPARPYFRNGNILTYDDSLEDGRKPANNFITINTDTSQITHEDKSNNRTCKYSFEVLQDDIINLPDKDTINAQINRQKFEDGQIDSKAAAAASENTSGGRIKKTRQTRQTRRKLLKKRKSTKRKKSSKNKK